MDELDGRRLAEQRGLRPLGALGVLLKAKRAGLIQRVTERVDRLRAELNFFISDALYRDFVRQAGE